MSALEFGRPAAHGRERTGTTSEMSEVEKLACEREARHDVLARHGLPSAAPVQEYLMHVRSTGGERPSRETSTAPRRRPRRGRDKADADALKGLRSWMRWGEDGGPDRPVIPFS
ncbi:hypothetical protein JKP76_13895 [Blastococcus sp. TML/C7B]|uniref:hypothetical protein n=1 Tax=unclassified Blastococcus TaxID=2619396 RepID=UPI00190ACF45|nr:MULTISPECIES: hypothetical protein [unclassified Blastococcus]MBN1097035.1 hypothetical protein [Blastococcus sp. TML/C7B]